MLDTIANVTVASDSMFSLCKNENNKKPVVETQRITTHVRRAMLPLGFCGVLLAENNQGVIANCAKKHDAMNTITFVVANPSQK